MQPVVVEEGQEQSFGSVDMKQFTVNPHMSQSKSQKMIQPKKRTIDHSDEPIYTMQSAAIPQLSLGEC